MSVTFLQSPGWVQRCLNEPQAMGVVAVRAQAAAAIANAAAPHIAEYGVGHPEVGPEGARAQVTTGSSFWHIVEFGSAKYAGVHSPAYAPFRRGALGAGMDYEMTL